MGFHRQKLGFASPQVMRDAMNSEAGQLEAFVRFIRADPRLSDALQRQDWSGLAGVSNGPGQIDAYASRLANAYEREAA
jgi:N-acetylmuramidase